MTKSYVLIVQHEDGRTKYFGPLEDAERALYAASAYFSYENTPFTISVTRLLEPLGSNFIQFREESNGL